MEGFISASKQLLDIIQIFMSSIEAEQSKFMQIDVFAKWSPLTPTKKAFNNNKKAKSPPYFPVGALTAEVFSP